MFDEPAPLQRGDKLFINNQRRQHLDIAESYQYYGYKRSGLMRYSSAYKQAADTLVQTLHVNSSPDISLDALVLPIVFLYRHYVELTLKDLVSDGNEKFGNPHIKLTKYGHKIDQWWKVLKPLLLRLYALEKPSEEIEALEACLLEFSKIDEESDAFRYPEDKDENPTLKNKPHLQSLDYIDVHHLAEKMASIEQFFLESSIKFVKK